MGREQSKERRFLVIARKIVLVPNQAQRRSPRSGLKSQTGAGPEFPFICGRGSDWQRGLRKHASFSSLHRLSFSNRIPTWAKRNQISLRSEFSRMTAFAFSSESNLQD